MGIDADNATVTRPVITVSEAALEKILEIRSAEDDPDTLGLRIEITGEQGVEYSYDLSFFAVAEAGPDDHVTSDDGLPLIIPSQSIDRLTGSVLDLPVNPAQGGFVIRNPNRPDPLAGIDLELTGDLPDKVGQLIDQAINPSLAMHGGFVSLVGVEGSRVFVSMGGGCQGCAISAMTLRDGIEAAIREAIPEVTEVVDTTDHMAGDNPYYT